MNDKKKFFQNKRLLLLFNSFKITDFQQPRPKIKND